MPGNLLHVNATVTCPHGGQVTFHPAQPRVLVDGQPAATLADRCQVVGCTFSAGGKPQPCVSVHWPAPSARVRIAGSPALLAGSPGVCQSAELVPQGPALVATVQQRAVGQ
jgi:uncharacterized Zn-binding protein involved in type VI secretion